MEIKDALDIMNSDYKLWQAAEDEEHGGGKVTKTIDLPWGIGEVAVKMEGMNDAGKRRAAVGAYGDYIRGLIRERIADDQVTARAKQAAAKAQPLDSADGDEVSGGLGVLGQVAAAQATPATDEAAARSHEGHAPRYATFGEELAARRAACFERSEQLQRELDGVRRELKGLDAALAAMEDE